MREIKLTVRGDTVHASRDRAGVQGEANATALVVSFDESWDGYAKKITFWDAREQNPVVRTLTADLLVDIISDTRTYRTTIPGEPLALNGDCLLVIDGYKDGARARSMSLQLTVVAAPVAEDAGEPADPTPTQAEQLQVQIEAIIGDIQLAAQAADGAKRAEEAAKNAESFALHQPVVGDNGNWWLWNGEEYADSGMSSRGEDGKDGVDGAPGPAGPKGDPGDPYTLTEEDKQEIVDEVASLCANALAGTASGAVVRLDDVSPLETAVQVQVTGVEDPRWVTVSAQGKNLWSAGAVGADFPGSYTGSGISLYAPCPVTVSYVPSEDFATSREIWRCEVTMASGVKYYMMDADAVHTKTFPGTADNPIVSVVFRGYYITAGGLENIQVELGSAATDYEPYREPVTCTPDETGTCAIAPITPAMTLSTDWEEAVLGCTYNRDINKAFAQLTQAILSLGGNI